MVVGFAVIPDELNIVKSFFNETVFLSFEFLSTRSKIHGTLDNEGVISQTESCINMDIPFQSTGFWKS